MVAGRRWSKGRDGDDGPMADGAGPDSPSCWWWRVAGAQEDRAGGWALDDSQEPKHACIGAVVASCFVALGRLALQNAGVYRPCDGS